MYTKDSDGKNYLALYSESTFVAADLAIHLSLNTFTNMKENSSNSAYLVHR